MKSAYFVKGLSLSAALLAGTAFAASGLQLVNTVQQVQVTTDADGVQHKTVGPMGRALPGSELVYTTAYHNVGKQAVDAGAAITDPIPDHTVYVPGSAEGAGTDITFSVDGGKTWGAPEALKVKNADGTLSDAQAKDYTTIRWVLKGKLAPGATGTVSFHAVLQ